MLEGLAGGFVEISQPWNAVLLLLGTGLGILVGALPGLSSPMAIVVLLPITYTMDTVPALLLMIGIYVGTKLGGSYAAILLRTPGTPASACTALDGFPMAMKGQAGLALGYATLGSTAGGLIGWVIAVSFIPAIAAVAVESSAADIALIGVAGLVMVSAFTRGSMIRGLMGVLVGILVGCIGFDPMDSMERFTFGQYQLYSGVPFAAALVGLFGFTVVLSDITMIGRASDMVDSKVNLALPKLADMLSRWRAWIIGSLYGTGIGAIPGVGADGATWLSYGTVRNSSKDPSAFGTGVPEGILAPESANNATTGGTMVPMLTLGIPGDASTAVMLGAMLLHGLQPGVTLMKNSADVVYAMLAGLLVSTILMFLISWRAIRFFVFFLQRDRAWLFPFILVFATLGAFSADNTYFAIGCAIVFGVIGFALESRGFPVVTIVLGLILGPIIEYNMRNALALSAGDWTTFIGTWPRIVVVALISLLVLNEVRHTWRRPAPLPPPADERPV